MNTLDTFLKDLQLSDVTALLTICGLIFAFYKYFDQRSREIQSKRFKEYRDLLYIAAAFDPQSDRGVPKTIQIASIIDLSDYEEYSKSILNALKSLRPNISSPEIIEAIDYTIDKLNH